jgi:hypothetical protein
MGADPAANPWERVFLLDQLPCLFIPSLPGQSQVADDVFPGGAVVITGRGLIHIERADIPPVAGLVDQGRSEGHGEVGHIGLGPKHNLLCHHFSFFWALDIGYWIFPSLTSNI